MEDCDSTWETDSEPEAPEPGGEPRRQQQQQEGVCTAAGGGEEPPAADDRPEEPPRPPEQGERAEGDAGGPEQVPPAPGRARVRHRAAAGREEGGSEAVRRPDLRNRWRGDPREGGPLPTPGGVVSGCGTPHLHRKEQRGCSGGEEASVGPPPSVGPGRSRLRELRAGPGGGSYRAGTGTAVLRETRPRERCSRFQRRFRVALRLVWNLASALNG